MNSIDFFGNAKWLTSGTKDTVCMRGEFAAKDIASAELYICGLGMFTVKINGVPASDDCFGTLSTDFHEHNDYCKVAFGEEHGYRICVSKLDVTELISENNCIAVALAPGWYHCKYTKWGIVNDYGDPKLCFRLILTDKGGKVTELCSDPSIMRWTNSNIVETYFFEGETQDYQSISLEGWELFGYDMSSWSIPSEVEAPISNYELSDCPPDRVIRTIIPKLIGETENEYIYDCGENITGTPVLTQRGASPETLKFRVCERLKDGDIEAYTHHDQTSTFITDGKPREYRLNFCWNGFRYVGISKNAELPRVEVIHSDVPISSTFSSDNATLNWMYETFLRTQLDNMHCGIPSDCPHLEKRGYTGDGELVGEAAMLILDAKTFYRKWINDIADCQDKLSGHVQYTAPYTRCGGGPGGWGSAIIEVPYMYYKTYGDSEPLKQLFPNTLKYFDYLEAHSENDLVVSDQPEQWCLGDWCTPEKLEIPEPFVNTYFYVKSINRAIEVCKILEYSEKLPELSALAERKKQAIVKNYFDPSTGDFCGGIQGANCFALDLGLGDERTFSRLVEHYKSETWYDTGIFGTDILTRVLFEKGEAQLAFELMTSHGKYSFGKWMDDGCTTFPEYWTYNRSQNHPMFGAVTRYLFKYLLGIDQDKLDGGYSRLIIKPRLVKGLDRISGSIETRNGKASVAIESSNGISKLSFDIPNGSSAKLILDREYALPCGHSTIII